ncbi:dual oxidase 1-like [Sinocyclocheilus rhinocerous]|uniref:dual oxidase 1-like n=1 Tax=Sinocyclocheilus rhinocerous TaxID=307959 RepID=UPI0007B97E16|nr:PREDICTED: dual oxidase 1-like [Sinocyclocheilus rhinocerous]
MMIHIYYSVAKLPLILNQTGANSAIAWEVQRYDGWYNNLADHNRGATGAALVRLFPAQYTDGVYLPRQEPHLPNPRQISNIAMSGQSGLLSYRNRSVLSVAFGYHVWSEISESRRPGCPPEFLHIKVQKEDPVFGSNSSQPVLLQFQRAEWDLSTGNSPNNPRTQVNHVTAWIDGSSIYGSSSSWCDALRVFSRGLLASGSSQDMPRRSSSGYLMWSAPDPSTSPGSQELYEFGNAWANENIFTVTEGIIWFRYHNYLASKLHKEHPSWSDEELFQNARKRVIATFQNLAFYEWLPAYLGIPVTSYPGYQKYVDPGISAEFEAAAVRFGLTLAPPGVYKRNRTCHYKSAVNNDASKSPGLRLCNTFWNRNNPNMQSSQDVDELIMGMASQIAEREDNIIVEDLRDYMYGPLRFSRSDAVALTIQRGRDFGLPSYNQIRESLNMRPVNSWDEINPKLNNTQLLRELAELYENDTSRLDLFVGGLLESQEGPGPVFSSIILDQFERIRNADRFWFENKQNGLFTEEEIQAIRNTTFHDVLLDVTGAEEGDIQRNVFFWVNGDPCPQPQPITSSDLHPCTKASSMSYFDNSSKAGFGVTVVALFLFPVASYIVACVVARVRTARYKRFQKKLRGSTTDKKPAHETFAKEWLGHNTAPRQVALAFNEKTVLQTFDENGSLLSSHSLGNQDHLNVLISNDHQHRALLLKIPKEYDLVLFFEDVGQRSKFLGHLRSELEGRILTVKEMSEKEILRDAVTRAQREKIVETFFKHAFSKVLDIDKSDAGDLSNRTREALQCELTRVEFASVLGLKPDSLFVESMFTLADKDGNGYLSFREFLDVIVIFMTGTPEEKSKLLFSMHDIKEDGFLSKEEFTSLLRSFIDISGSALSKSQAEDGIAAMLQAAGLDNKDCFSWEDFHFLLRDHSAQLNIKGMEVLGKKKLSRQQQVSFIKKNSSSAVEELTHRPEGEQDQELRQRQIKKSSARGTPEEKSKLLFSMHDIKEDGFLSKEEFTSLLRSFIDISGSALSKSQAEDGMEVLVLQPWKSLLTGLRGSKTRNFVKDRSRRAQLGLISLNRKKVEIPVVKAELLPSDVTYLEFKRPQGFVYRSGQWVRIACLALGTDEYHPFTLTSAPHEETLSLHIRAVGPWTSKLREAYTPEKLQEFGGYPKLYLDGPFGEGHQEWKDYEVSVLVGAGIGVTPFASILKDLVFKSSVKFKFHCKKVYFIWVTRTQRQFEWVSDIIREVEDMDAQELVSVHFYITQLAEKFDLRTTMLYVCERHFQKVWNRSLFTGLRSITHFGRPPFLAFLSSLQEVHPEVEKIGVFSCGPPGLTKNVEKACQQMNKRDQTHFVHHYENF